MATSPNYAWAEPDNSSLVKNGAADIRTLGDAIDTSVWNIGYGQAGKNKIINGDFNIWQRGTSISLTNGVEVYTADRFAAKLNFSAGTSSVTQQTFTPGTAPVAGYESQYYARLTCGSTSTYGLFTHKIEDVRTFAGNTVTISLWAKASAAVTLSVTPVQNFGSGGSSPVNGSTGNATLTTSWVRYSFTQTLASISGKTVGTSSFVQVYTEFANNMNSATIDIWGLQVEYGSKATPFETATGTIQGELAACLRYFQVIAPAATYQDIITGASCDSTVYCRYPYLFPTPMRGTPTCSSTGTASDYANLVASGLATASATPAFYNIRNTGVMIAISSSAITTGQGTCLRNTTTTPSQWLTFSAEL